MKSLQRGYWFQGRVHSVTALDLLEQCDEAVNPLMVAVAYLRVFVEYRGIGQGLFDRRIEEFEEHLLISHR